MQIPESSIDRTAANAAKRMFIDAKEDIDDKYIITSAYRSASYQQELYEENIAGNLDKTLEKVLPAYASEHPTGMAIDILSEEHNIADEAFYYTPAGKWLNDNAYKYGFVLRYPKDEEDITRVTFELWHYRYVGQKDA